MKIRFFKGTALLLALILIAFIFTGCFSELDPYGAYNGGDIEDLIEVTASPEQLNTKMPTSAPTAEPGEKKTPVPTAAATETPTEAPTDAPTEAPTECPVKEDGQYDSKNEVALYILLFGRLPSNYIKKKDAQALGWTGGSLEPYAPGCSIGGDRFGNYEGILPTKKGRYYYECDIDTRGKSSRGKKRIVYSNDGLIYYTDDHYESFTLIGGDENA